MKKIVTISILFLLLLPIMKVNSSQSNIYQYEEPNSTRADTPKFFQDSNGVYWMAYHVYCDNETKIVIRNSIDFLYWSKPMYRTIHKFSADQYLEFFQGSDGLFYLFWKKFN